MNSLIILVLSFYFPAHAGTVSESKFSASEYFELIAPEVPRRSALPNRVHFEPVEIKMKEAMDLLRTNWRVGYSCSGRSPAKMKIDEVTKKTGRKYPRTNLLFLSDYEFQIMQADPTPASLRLPYLVYIQDEAKGILLFKAPRYMNGEIQVNRIVETGETVLIDRAENLNRFFEGVCADGERFEYVYVKEPVS